MNSWKGFDSWHETYEWALKQARAEVLDNTRYRVEKALTGWYAHPTAMPSRHHRGGKVLRFPRRSAL